MGEGVGVLLKMGGANQKTSILAVTKLCLLCSSLPCWIPYKSKLSFLSTGCLYALNPKVSLLFNPKALVYFIKFSCGGFWTSLTACPSPLQDGFCLFFTPVLLSSWKRLLVQALLSCFTAVILIYFWKRLPWVLKFLTHFCLPKNCDQPPEFEMWKNRTE